jgi:hypothetical protein
MASGGLDRLVGGIEDVGLAGIEFALYSLDDPVAIRDVVFTF